MRLNRFPGTKSEYCESKRGKCCHLNSYAAFCRFFGGGKSYPMLSTDHTFKYLKLDVCKGSSWAKIDQPENKV